MEAFLWILGNLRGRYLLEDQIWASGLRDGGRGTGVFVLQKVEKGDFAACLSAHTHLFKEGSTGHSPSKPCLHTSVSRTASPVGKECHSCVYVREGRRLKHANIKWSTQPGRKGQRGSSLLLLLLLLPPRLLAGSVQYATRIRISSFARLAVRGAAIAAGLARLLV